MCAIVDANITHELFGSDRGKAGVRFLEWVEAGNGRLLYSNDTALQQDFKDKGIIDNPRGKVYSTLQHSDFRPSHQELLRRKDLCRT